MNTYASLRYMNSDLEWFNVTNRCTICDLSGVTLTGNHSQANASYANFSGANLSYSDFKNASLIGVDFSHANLENVDFTGATLMNANLEDADLLNAKILPDQLASIKSKCNMIHPDGYSQGCEPRYKY